MLLSELYNTLKVNTLTCFLYDSYEITAIDFDCTGISCKEFDEAIPDIEMVEFRRTSPQIMDEINYITVENMGMEIPEGLNVEECTAYLEKCHALLAEQYNSIIYDSQVIERKLEYLKQNYSMDGLNKYRIVVFA